MCEALARTNIAWADANAKAINKIFKKIETKKSDTLTRGEKVTLSEYFDIRFTEGKLSGYLFMLQQMNGGDFTIPEEYKGLRIWVNSKLHAK